MKAFRNKVENKKERLIELNNEKKNVKIKMPGINDIKKKERIDLITKMENPILFQKKYTLLKQDKKKRVLLKKRNPDNKRLEWLYNLQKQKNDIQNNNNITEINSPPLLKKPKIIRIYSSFPKKNKNEIEPKKINYLEELKKKKRKKRSKK